MMKKIRDDEIKLKQKIKVLEVERNISESIQQIRNIDDELENLNAQLYNLKQLEKIYENR